MSENLITNNPYIKSLGSAMEIRKLNMLRGIAALIVMMSHFSNETNFFDARLGAGAGQIGVMLFFILSGFLMSYLYLDKDFKKNLANFVVARIARVIPLFVIVVLASYLFYAYRVTGIFYDISNIQRLLSHLLLFSGTDVLWTIPVEIHFYILFVLLWRLYQFKTGCLYILMSFLFISLMLINFQTPTWKILGLDLEMKIIPALPSFFVGIILGQLYPKWKVPTYLRKNIFVLSLLFLLMLYPKIFIILFNNNYVMWKDIGVLCVVSLVFFSLVFFVPDGNIFLANRIGDFLGGISYSLYLLHKPIFNLIKKPFQENSVIFFFVFIAISLLLSYISYCIVEHPARKVIRALATKQSFLNRCRAISKKRSLKLSMDFR